MQRQLYCHIKQYKVGTLAVDGRAVTSATALRGLGGAPARTVPSSTEFLSSFCNKISLMIKHVCELNIAESDVVVCLSVVSEVCDLISQCLSIRPCDRPSLEAIVRHPWMSRDESSASSVL